LDGDQDGKVSSNELYLSPALNAVISAETGTSPQVLLATYHDEEGNITFEDLKQAVKKQGI
jgi:Ca2+-binding EF-hand superfamily protein